MPIVFKMTWIELKLLAREPVTLVFSFAFPVLVLMVLGGICLLYTSDAADE